MISDAQTQSLIRSLQDALGRYDIGENRINFQGTTVTMIYPLSDLVPDNSIVLTTYSDSDCTVDISDNDFIVPEIIYDDNPLPDGTKNREVTIHYTIDPIKVQGSDIWVQRSDDQFFMNFCVGLSLSTGDVSDPNSVSISGIDTVVLLQVDLLGDFGAEVVVAEGDRLDEEASQVYYVEGFLCDTSNNRIVYSTPLTQGTLVRVCVKPQDDALADGVYMRRVESFTFQREDQVGGAISQRAVRDGQSANKALTELVCIRGSDLCHFDTLLNADFYFGAGTVTGFGEAWLQVSHRAWYYTIHEIRVAIGNSLVVPSKSLVEAMHAVSVSRQGHFKWMVDLQVLRTSVPTFLFCQRRTISLLLPLRSNAINGTNRSIEVLQNILGKAFACVSRRMS
jgi:hypothetical protein